MNISLSKRFTAIGSGTLCLFALTLGATGLQAASNAAKPSAKELAAGKQVYAQTCAACHQATGSGVPGAFPPLAKSDFLNSNHFRAIDIVLHGHTGPITVNGGHFGSVAMPPQSLSDQQIADVLTYVLNSWGNGGGVVTEAQVKNVKANGPAKAQSEAGSGSGMPMMNHMNHMNHMMNNGSGS